MRVVKYLLVYLSILSICVSEISPILLLIFGVLVRGTSSSYGRAPTPIWIPLFKLGKDAGDPLRAVDVVYERAAEGMPHLQVIGRVKVKVLAAASVRPQEGRLKRETVNQLELTPHYLPCARLLAFLHQEGAVFKVEHVSCLSE